MFQLELAIMDYPEQLTRNGKTYFASSELGQHDTGEGKLAPGFGEKLLDLRVAFGRPMYVNSCCRSKRYNEKINGSPRSLHVYDRSHHPTCGTCAIDISTQYETPEYRSTLIQLALDAGWSVGEYKNFVHLDRRSDYTNLPQTVFNGGY